MLEKKTPLVEMNDISVSFGGIKAVDGASSICTPGRWSPWWGTTAPASRR